MKTTKEVLLEAASYIETHGLLKGSFGEAEGPCCIRGAINLVAFGVTNGTTVGWLDDPEYDEKRRLSNWAVDAVATEIGAPDLELYGRQDAVADWNDDPERTRREVLATMRAAAERP